MRAFLLPLVPLLLVAGCADSGSFPSLAQRPIERELPPPDVDPLVAPAADDPSIAARIAGFVAQARKAQAEFDAVLPEAESAVRRAGPPESQSWILAQQALSRAEAAQAATARSLSDFDTYSVETATASPPSPADSERLRAGLADLQKIADFEHDQVARLEGMIRTP